MSLNIFKKKPVVNMDIYPGDAMPGDVTLVDRQKAMADLLQAQGVEAVPVLTPWGQSQLMGQQNVAANNNATQNLHNLHAQQKASYGSGTATKAEPDKLDRLRVIIETANNGFTLHCGGEIYVAANVEDLQQVLKVALVTAKLVGHLVT